MSDKAQALVQRMVDAGEWPEPKLLDEILAQGHAAVAPLVEVVRKHPRGWPGEAPLQRALALLAILRAPEAIPALVELFRHYEDDTMHMVAEALRGFGPQAINPVLEVADDGTLPYPVRAAAASVAAETGREDPESRAQAAAALRGLLAECLARAPEQVDEDEFGYGGEEWEEELIDTASELAFELAELADPQGRDLIKDAFEAGIVDEEILDGETVEELYGPEPPPPEPLNPHQLLQEYRDNYREYHRWERPRQRREPRPRPLPEFTAPSEGPGAFGPPPPLHKTERPGRNDPCWCGSGKKYKKCHMLQDQQ